MLLGLLGLAALSVALDPTLDTEWEDWKGLHGKTYQEGDEASRRAIWEENWRMIEQHNWEASQGKHSYRMGMNHLGDMTDEEFEQRVSCSLPDDDSATKNVSFLEPSPAWTRPRSVDWRTRDYVTPVKRQGECGACWAFSATGALEALHARTHGRLVPLSEQQLVDCSALNNGCRGGQAVKAFQYVQRVGGLNSAHDYPYEEHQRQCRARAANVRIRIRSVVPVLRDSEAALEEAVAKYGPVSVATDCGSRKLEFYKSGIYSESCGPKKLGHAMLVVGYGEANGRKYWIIKNSHGVGFGVHGYLYLQKGYNLCGIARYAHVPV